MRGEFFPTGINLYVPNCLYAAEVALEAQFTARYDTAPVAASATGILSAQSIATAGSTSTFATTFLNSEAQMSRFGRAVQVVASGAAASTVTVNGFDFLGQPMRETLTLNGTTPVLGVKAFRRITLVEFGATAATTINLGWRDAFGIPYASIGNATTFTDTVRDGTQATQVAYTATQTLTSSDPRGLFVPASAALPNGTRRYTYAYEPLRTNLYGPRHVVA
jgi:hypothetical protein